MPRLVRGARPALALVPESVVAQAAPPPAEPLPKTIGQARPEAAPSLIVMNAAGATLDGTTLTLKEIAGDSIVFADRPVRAAGHAPTPALLGEWNPSCPDGFHADPPNAAVSVFGGTEKNACDAVTLKSPRMQGADLVFDVDVPEGSIAGATGPAAVFIDIIGRPLTPFSYAGVARRAAYRGAWCAGAAAAADPYRPHPHGAPLCGYPPYPPC